MVARNGKLNKIFGLFSNILTYSFNYCSSLTIWISLLGLKPRGVFKYWPVLHTATTSSSFWATAINWELIPPEPTKVHTKAVVIALSYPAPSWVNHQCAGTLIQQLINCFFLFLCDWRVQPCCDTLSVSNTGFWSKLFPLIRNGCQNSVH